MFCIQRIFICSDFLMTKEKEQASNRRWMMDLLSRPLQMATGIRPESFSSSLTSADKLSRMRFFELSGLRLDIDRTQFWFDDRRINAQSRGYLEGFLDPSVLILGYELSEQTRRILDDMQVPWVDMWLHPIRYLDDILFGFSSSSQAVYNEISTFALKNEIFDLYADRLRIQYYKGYRRPNHPIKNGSALFIGQTLEDKAVCRDGKMLNLLDFKTEFEAVAAKYAKIYYSRHPYVRGGDEEILKYVKQSGVAQIVDWPSYEMLASGRIHKALSISSSVIYEARHFGVDAEFLFQPVIRYGTDRSKNEYLSVYQVFVSPHFWSRALKPLMAVNDCEPIMFLEGKDKLRDMLGFYWSYRHVDKLEDMRQTLLAIGKRLEPVSNRAKAREKKQPFIVHALHEQTRSPQPWDDVKGLIKDKMRRHEVISFDIFDTLIERPFRQANDIFDAIEPDARRIMGIADLAFREQREKARGLVADGAHGEEITLNERYKAMVQNLALPANKADELQALEERAELHYCRPRRFGREMYELAIALGKKIILVSDTYFDKAFIERLLEKNGFVNDHVLYVSSETGVLKATGRMFEHISQELGIKGSQVLHFGDNPDADVKPAEAFGWTAWYTPRCAELFDKESRLAALPKVKRGGLSGSIMQALVANKLFWRPENLAQPSHAGSNPEDFGYAIAGPMFFGFAKWVAESALKDGVETLYFLSRDGDIVKRCYDAISVNYDNAPQAVYLKASRRALSVASIFSRQDLVDLLDVNFTPTPISLLMQNRFGIKDISTDVYAEAGFYNSDECADIKVNKENIVRLIDLVCDEILRNAAEERDALLGYYAEQGLLQDKRHAVVDIGHNGTLQASISRLTNSNALSGYYFVTYKDVIRNIESKGMKAAGYFGERIDPATSGHPYIANILMYEAIFLNDESTFIRTRKIDGSWRHECLESPRENGRKQFIHSVHDQVVKFAEDMAQVFSRNLADTPFDADLATAHYRSFLDRPTLADASLFKNVAFENVYSGRDTRMIISCEKEDSGAFLERSIWKQGAMVVMAPDWHKPPRTLNIFYHVLRVIVRRTSTVRLYHKFLRNPRKFFQDSKKPHLRFMAVFFRKNSNL